MKILHIKQLFLILVLKSWDYCFTWALDCWQNVIVTMSSETFSSFFFSTFGHRSIHRWPKSVKSGHSWSFWPYLQYPYYYVPDPNTISLASIGNIWQVLNNSWMSCALELPEVLRSHVKYTFLVYKVLVATTVYYKVYGRS